MKENKTNNSKPSYPVLILRNFVLFPFFSLNVSIGRLKSIKAITAATEQYDNKIFVLCQKFKDLDNPNIDADNIYMVGTLAKIENVSTLQDGTLNVELNGIKRAKISEIIATNEMYFGYGELLETKKNDSAEEKALFNKINHSIAKYLKIAAQQKGGIPAQIMPKKVYDQINDSSSDTAEEVTDAIAHHVHFLPIEKKQKLLEELELKNRLEILNSYILEQIKIFQLEQTIESNIKRKMENWQKEYFLREKIKAIKEELGDGYDRDSDIDKIKKFVKENPFPEPIKKRIIEEIMHLETSPAGSAEANVIRTYIDWLVKVPWWQKTEESVDFKKAKAHLDKNHYGLDKPKERIIEYLAVKKNTKKLKGQIICFLGAPGVGKTSFAKSIASAINRNFVKASLGGVRDESEIRGHRRTYIGSMPGRIVQGMCKAKSMNPVFLLDEIDKMSSDFRGDPASALLEVLDPEQNIWFSDHYLEVDYDLSDVIFITTANYYEQIPEPLLDRMEIITLHSYTELEKLEIGLKHLLPKVLENHGLTAKQLKFSKTIMLDIIRHYTREAGVRQLERAMSKIARKTVLEILNKKTKSTTVNKKNLIKYLGQPIFNFTKKQKKSEVGVVTGLAYTTYGGDVLPIEVTYFNGQGKLLLTGQLGEVMKESANIALGYIKSENKKFGIDKNFFEKIDIHIHVPEGAVPKDGPSAGITLTTAMISALTKKPVNLNIGMTGEITLRGKVLPIGGLKEKLISADRSLLKTVFIPFDNKKDLDDVPEEVKKRLEIVYVKDYLEVFKHIFTK